jgi:hypothetical protein
MKRKELLYYKETNWGTHTVTEGYGKYAGMFVAQSQGWGGARGYFRVFGSLEEAKDYIDKQTAPASPSKRITL